MGKTIHLKILLSKILKFTWPQTVNKHILCACAFEETLSAVSPE